MIHGHFFYRGTSLTDWVSTRQCLNEEQHYNHKSKHKSCPISCERSPPTEEDNETILKVTRFCRAFVTFTENQSRGGLYSICSSLRVFSTKALLLFDIELHYLHNHKLLFCKVLLSTFSAISLNLVEVFEDVCI